MRKLKKFKMPAKQNSVFNWFLKYPTIISITGVFLLLSSYMYFGPDSTLKYEGEPEIFDEYVSVISEELDYDKGKVLFNNLVSLVAELTTSCQLGIEEDHIVFARSLSKKNKWQIYIDGISDQGSRSKVNAKIKKIGDSLANLEEDTCLSTVSDESKKAYQYLDEAFVTLESKEEKHSPSAVFYGRSKFNEIYNILSVEQQTAIFAAVTSFCAIGIAFWQGLINRQHNKLSVRPLLSFNKEAIGRDYVISLQNIGLGPAILEKVVVSVDNKTIEKDFLSALIEAMEIFEVDHLARKINDPGEGHAINQEGLVELIRIKDAMIDDNAKTTISNEMLSLDISIIYRSFYGEKFNVRLTQQ